MCSSVLAFLWEQHVCAHQNKPQRFYFCSPDSVFIPDFKQRVVSAWLSTPRLGHKGRSARIEWQSRMGLGHLLPTSDWERQGGVSQSRCFAGLMKSQRPFCLVNSLVAKLMCAFSHPLIGNYPRQRSCRPILSRLTTRTWTKMRSVMSVFWTKSF